MARNKSGLVSNVNLHKQHTFVYNILLLIYYFNNEKYFQENFKKITQELDYNTEI